MVIDENIESSTNFDLGKNIVDNLTAEHYPVEHVSELTDAGYRCVGGYTSAEEIKIMPDDIISLIGNVASGGYDVVLSSHPLFDDDKSIGVWVK